MRWTWTLAALCLCLAAACSADDPSGGVSTGKGRDAGKDGKGDGDVGSDETPDVTRIDDACASIRQDAPTERAAVDVVWVIDTSASMIDDIAQITAQIGNFMKQFESSNADTRAVMLTGFDPATGTPLA